MLGNDGTPTSECVFTPKVTRAKFFGMKTEKQAMNLPNNVVDVLQYQGKDFSHDLLSIPAHLQDSKSFNEMEPSMRADLMFIVRDMHRIWLLIS